MGCKFSHIMFCTALFIPSAEWNERLGVVTQSAKSIFNPRWWFSHGQSIYWAWRNYYKTYTWKKNQQLPGLALNLASPNLTFLQNFSIANMLRGVLCYDMRIWLQGLQWKLSLYFFHLMACPLRGAFALFVRQYGFFSNRLYSLTSWIPDPEDTVFFKFGVKIDNMTDFSEKYGLQFLVRYAKTHSFTSVLPHVVLLFVFL